MKRWCFTAIFLICMMVGTLVFAQEIIIWKWVDETGKINFTSNFNSIPERFRTKAMQGKFTPDSTPSPGKGTNKDPNNNHPKPTNKLEIFDEKYSEKDDILIISGNVKNGFAQPISNIKVKVTFSDENEAFIKVETTFVQPIQLQPNEKGQYKIEVPYTPDIGSYKTEIVWE